MSKHDFCVVKAFRELEGMSCLGVLSAGLDDMDVLLRRDFPELGPSIPAIGIVELPSILRLRWALQGMATPRP